MSVSRGQGMAKLGISRSGVYYTAFALTLAREIDQAFTEWPFPGARRMRDYLAPLGYGVGKKRVRRLMRLMGLEPIQRKPRTSISHPEHKRYPYLPRNPPFTRPNQVWCAIPMRKGFLYLVAIMDRHSRNVLSWRLSNTMDAAFRVAALEDALAKYGNPGILNTDQGGRFTSLTFTDVLRENGIHISMDGRGRWLDNVFIERLWRSLKYEHVYPRADETGSVARAGIGKWFDFYNRLRPHGGLGGLPPDWRYEQGLLKAA